MNAELPPASDLEQALRNGVILAKLAHFFAPDIVALRKVYDAEEAVFNEKGLVFRHTENINHWLRAMASKKFPEVFVVFCVKIFGGLTCMFFAAGRSSIQR